MATPHQPCWDAWDSEDASYFDAVWRVDFVVHIFTNGRVACSILPVSTVDGDEVCSSSSPSGVEQLLTVVVTSSPVQSNPSTRMLLECLASLDRNAGLGRCRKLIMCDGFKVRSRSQRKQGVITDEEVCRYRAFVQEVARLCRADAAFRRTRLVRLARRQGSAFAIREAVEAHVRTPFVIVVPHDCIVARPVKLEAVAAAMHASPTVRYVKLASRTTTYAQTALSQYGVRLRPTGLCEGYALLPMLRYMDNVSIVSAPFLRDTVFATGSGVRRGTFIEDTFGKQTQMKAWLQSAAFAAKQPPPNGCFLLLDGVAEPMMRHLDGKVYLDPEQRAAAGLRPYPHDWTAALRQGEDTARKDVEPLRAAAATEEGALLTQLAPEEGDAAPVNAGATVSLAAAAGGAVASGLIAAGRVAPSLTAMLMLAGGAAAAAARAAVVGEAEGGGGGGCSSGAKPAVNGDSGSGGAPPRPAFLLTPMRDALCWDSLSAGGCGAQACCKLKPTHEGRPVCGRHATSLLELWGRRRRPPCAGGCGAAHPTLAELEAAIREALPAGSRMHAREVAPPKLGCGEARGARTLWVVSPSSVSSAEVDSALDARSPMALRVAIDVGFDDLMSDGERKSLASQCGLCHSIASQAEHRPHVALAVCCGTGGGERSLSLLRAAGLEQWQPLSWQGGSSASLLSMPGTSVDDLVYLSPDAPDVLSELMPSAVYVIGGLVDRHKVRGASRERAAALGIRCARLPLAEHLPADMRGKSNALDALNVNAVFRLLVEWSRSRDWTAAIATALDGAQRHCGSASGLIHPHGFWDGPRIASQHQYDLHLSAALLAFFRAEGAQSVVDLGCGMGSYVRHFSREGLRAIGLDGNPSTPQLSKGACGVLDLSVIAEVAEPCDWVLSLEVGEHLPKVYEAAFMENLNRFNTQGMVLSWALEGQGGTGHVNEQSNDYIKAKICALGYVNDANAEASLRQAAQFAYFKRTIMVFRRTAWQDGMTQG